LNAPLPTGGRGDDGERAENGEPLSLTILVVEDNALTRKLMRLALAAERYTVVEADDGESALRIFAERPPALVLLDCRLPDMDGFEVGRRMRALAPNIPTIAVTGWAQVDERRVAEAGFSEVLEKPVEPSRLVEAVGRHLGHAPLQPASSGRTVLLADDDPTQRKLARIHLSNAGFDVMLAEDGESALRLATARKPDAIVSDVLMPGMDGFALCKHVRSDSNLARVPVVLMSAYYLENADRELAARFGASRFVSRTEGFDAVVRALLEVIDAPVAELVDAPTTDLRAEYLRRIAHQLERQANISRSLARRATLQASALTFLDDLSESLAQELDPESALSDTLDRCLDAAGISLGAILLCTESGQLSLRAHVGATADLGWAKYSEILLRAVSRGGLLIPSVEAGNAGDELLVALSVTSALVVPIKARHKALGVLLLGSNGTDLGGDEAESAVRAARSVATQLGQALALSQMLSKLASVEQRYRALLENAHDGIAITTPEGIILEVNRRMEVLLGFPREQAVGRHITDFAAKDGQKGSVAAHDTLVAKGTGAEDTGSIVPTAIKRPDGSVVQVEFSTTVVEIAGARCVLSIGRDVSRRLELEEHLRQAQKMEAVGRLAGGVAHDFNNMLSVIISYAEMLLAELKPDAPMREGMEEIRKAGTRAAALTRQLLMFSRQQVVEPKVLDLNYLLSGIDKMLRRILGTDVDLVLLSVPILGRVCIDPGSMEQVIVNLTVNARDAMPTGGKLTVETSNVILDDAYARAHAGVQPGPYVVLAVTDTGVGMDKATQANIFEPFYTTKGPGLGTGLGLSTVFGVVHQSGGSVWVYSEPGKGTTFKVYLPRVDAPIDDLRLSEAPTEQRGTETILLVEDDDQVRAVARGILRKNGYEVIEARNAGEALMQSERHPGVADLLLTEVVMPQVSGPELAKRLASLQPDMRVLFMSGYTDDSIVRHGVLASNIAYLQKPLTPRLLTAKVREVLDAASGRTP
jgi:PAS domain S-box-containing protein